MPQGSPSDRRRLTALRMAAQRIGVTEFRRPAEAVRWMLALQGQDFAGVKWSAGLRHAGATEAGVAAALDAGEIVRSWPMRGTLHLVAAEDLGWMLRLTAPRMATSAARRRAWLEITDTDIDRARAALVDALAEVGVLTREQVLRTIEAGGVSTAGQRGYHLIWFLAQTGTLVLGPTAGTEQGFALLESWVPAPRPLDHEEALGELALRYFRSHGPATDHDLARWSGLTLGEVRRGRAIASPQLANIEVGGTTYHLAPETLDLEPGAGTHLLPGFDEYLLGYGDRSAALPADHSDRIVPGGNGVFRPTIVADGEVVGTWARRDRARETVIEPVWFSPPAGGRRRRLEESARAYGLFIGRPVRIEIDGARSPAGTTPG